jgi:tol-pal system protein YbgF
MAMFQRKLHNAALAGCLLLMAGHASAQEQERSSPGLLDNLFNRGETTQRQNAQAAASDLAVRIDRLENQLRQMTGTIEQLQFRNQQLEQELARAQGGAQVAAGVGAPRMAAPITAPQALPAQAMSPQAMSPQALPATSGRRSDAFDPSQNPGAPGAPRALGGGATAMPSAPIQSAPIQEDVAVGAPGGRAAGAPLDLSTLTSAPRENTQTASADPNAALPAPPPRNTSRTGGQLATLPPSANPKDEYDLAYGYVLHKDYALAEKAFADFLRKNPNDKQVADAHYWLGESLFQRQRYQDAADSYLVVVRNYESADKAPDSLLRLGQSLAALGQKEMACASLGEVNRKYPRASAGVKRGVTAEQKRAHC